MPISEHQRRLRHPHLGSSDGPPLLGVDAYGRTVTDVYWDKISPLVEREPTAAMQTGNRLEPAEMDFAAERIGRKLRRNQFRVSPYADGGIMAANFDALVESESACVEGKYVGPAAADQWGSDGSDEIPDHVQVQVQHQLYVGGLDRCYVAAVIAGRYALDWRLYVVQRHEELIRLIVEREVSFWRNHIEPKVPPTDEPPPLAVLKALRREPESVVDLDEAGAACIAEWEKAKATASAAKDSEKGWERHVIALFGEAEAARLPDGRTLTYLAQTRRAYEVKESTFRVLRLKGAKA